MSAIFGIIDFAGRPLEDEWIASMQKDLAHRGPDGQGLYQEPSVAMGHLLLQVTPESIYDKSPYEEDGFVITAYARLDEREAIMKRLNIPLEERDKITDPLLLLRSFRKFGQDFVKDIYGDFAFAIWNKEKKELFCARDQMGVKPFLYYHEDNRFVFSTELRAIVKLSFVKTNIDHNYIKKWVTGFRGEPNKTTWMRINRLLSARIIRVNLNELVMEKYWQPVYKYTKIKLNEIEIYGQLLALTKKVISDHLRSNFTKGAHLSGGLDSGSIVCLAARELLKKGENLVTVSSVLSEKTSDPEKEDEMEFVREILNQEKNITAKFVYHNNLEYFNGLHEFYEKHFTIVNEFYYVDEAINRQFISANTRRVLSGSFGDLTISNHSINPFVFLFNSGRLLALSQLISETRRNHPQSLSGFIKAKILLDLIPQNLLNLYFRIKGKEIKKDYDIRNLPLFFKPEERKTLQKRFVNLWHTSSNNSRGITNQIIGFDHHLFEEYLDCGSSYYSVEMTYPYVDRRIVEFLLKIPIEYFYAGGLKRGLIRRTMNGILPQKVCYREDKRDYSPGHSLVYGKDADKIIGFLSNLQSTNPLKNLIDFTKLKIIIQNIFEIRNNRTFAFDTWNILRIFTWVYFDNWTTKNKSCYDSKQNEERMV